MLLLGSNRCSREDVLEEDGTVSLQGAVKGKGKNDFVTSFIFSTRCILVLSFYGDIVYNLKQLSQ